MKDSSDTAGTDNGTRQDEQSGGPDGQMGDVAGSKDDAGMVSGDFSLIGFWQLHDGEGQGVRL